MKLLTVCICIFFGFTEGINEHEINQGASTSRVTNTISQLNYDEECEVGGYVDNVINMLLELYRSANRNIEQEFETSITYIRLIIEKLKFGSNYTQGNNQSFPLLSNHRERRSFFTRVATGYVAERMIEANLQNFQNQCRDPSLRSIFDNNAEFFNMFQLMEMLSRLDVMLHEANGRELVEEEFNLLFIDFRYSMQRFRRSLNLEKDICISLKYFSRKRWSEFIVFVMRAFIEFKKFNESTAWSCDFVYLFDKYKSDSSFNSLSSCLKTNFGDYLYSRISHLETWNNCLEFDESENPIDWCQAWRRIMLNSDISIDGSLQNTPTEKFHRDLKTVIHWLREKISTSSESRQNPSLNEGSENLVCYKNSTSLSCPNYCESSSRKVISLKAKRSLLLQNYSMYDREWLKDADNKLRCKCFKDDISFKRTTTPSTFTKKPNNWLSSLLENAWNSRCAKGSVDHDSARCDELRRK